MIFCLTIYLSACGINSQPDDAGERNQILISPFPSESNIVTELSPIPSNQATQTFSDQSLNYEKITTENIDELVTISQEPVSYGIDFVWIETGEYIALSTIESIKFYKGIKGLEIMNFADVPASDPRNLVSAQGTDIISWIESDNIIRFVKLGDLENVVSINSDQETVVSITLTVDEQTLAVSRNDYSIEIWDLSAQQMVNEWSFSFLPGNLSYSPDGDYLAALDKMNSSISIIDTRSGDIERTIELGEPISSNLIGISFSNDWSHIGWVDGSTVHIMRMEDEIIVNQLYHEDSVTALAWSDDNQLIATASVAFLEEDLSPVLNFWSINSGSEIKVIPHDSVISRVSFSPAGNQLGILENSGVLSFWAVQQ